MTDLQIVSDEKISTLDFLVKINGLRFDEGISPIDNNKFINRVEDEIDDLSVGKIFQPTKGGKPQRFYMLNKEQALLVGMRESKIVRRGVLSWIKSLESPKLPKTFAEALQVAADAHKQLELQAPKIAVHDTITNSNKLSNISEVAALYGMGRNNMYRWLREQNIVQIEMNKPYQKYIDSGHFDFKIETKNKKSYYTTLITGKGIALIGNLMTN